MRLHRLSAQSCPAPFYPPVPRPLTPLPSRHHRRPGGAAGLPQHPHQHLAAPPHHAHSRHHPRRRAAVRIRRPRDVQVSQKTAMPSYCLGLIHAVSRRGLFHFSCLTPSPPMLDTPAPATILVPTPSSPSSPAPRFLLITQVVLALQLPVTLVPLIKATSSRALMGHHASSRLLAGAAWCCAGLVFVPGAVRNAAAAAGVLGK